VLCSGARSHGGTDDDHVADTEVRAALDGRLRQPATGDVTLDRQNAINSYDEERPLTPELDPLTAALHVAHKYNIDELPPPPQLPKQGGGVTARQSRLMRARADRERKVSPNAEHPSLAAPAFCTPVRSHEV
jgi:hypothetical protein